MNGALRYGRIATVIWIGRDSSTFLSKLPLVTSICGTSGSMVPHLSSFSGT